MNEVIFREEIVEKDIIGAARALFQQYGFKKTTMGDIARSLGRGKSSLYYYYPGKEDIFEAVISAEMDELLAQIHTSIARATSSKEKLIIYCRCRLHKLSQLCNLSDALKSEIAELQTVMSDLKSRFDTTHVELVKEILAEGVNNGEFKKLNQKNIELVAFLMVSSFRSLAIPLMVSPQEYPRLDLQIDTIVDIMVHGIGK